MIRLCVICEGQTESDFVRSCLQQDLWCHGVSVYPSILKTKPALPTGVARYQTDLPARHRARHVWSFWSQVARE